MSRWRVTYVAGPYSGTREVGAEDADEACAIVRRWVRREMTLPMYSDSYRAEELPDDDYDPTPYELDTSGESGPERLGRTMREARRAK